MKIRGRFGNLCILPSLFLPTTCPRTKPALLHLTAACGKTFLLSLLRHSSRLKNAMFLILLPRSCPTAPLHCAEPRCEVEQRRWPSCCLARGSGSRNCPGQEGLASPIPTCDSSMARTHPGWVEQQLPARGAAMPGPLGISRGDTGTEHRPLCRHHWCSESPALVNSRIQVKLLLL